MKIAKHYGVIYPHVGIRYHKSKECSKGLGGIFITHTGDIVCISVIDNLQSKVKNNLVVYKKNINLLGFSIKDYYVVQNN